MKTEKENFIDHTNECVKRLRFSRINGESKVNIVLEYACGNKPMKESDVLFNPSVDVRILNILSLSELYDISAKLDHFGYKMESFPFKKYLIDKIEVLEK